MHRTDTYTKKQLKKEFGLSDLEIELLLYWYKKRTGKPCSDYLINQYYEFQEETVKNVDRELEKKGLMTSEKNPYFIQHNFTDKFLNFMNEVEKKIKKRREEQIENDEFDLGE